MTSVLKLKTPSGGSVYLSPKDRADNITIDPTQGYYLPAGTGAIPTTVQAKLRESVSVKDFGAVGDGVTDDSLAIQNAISSAAASGFPLIFPKGNYKIFCPIGGVFSSVSGVDGFSIVSQGATISDATVYSAALVERSMFINFTTCSNVGIIGGLHIQSTREYTGTGGAVSPGLDAITFNGLCQNIIIDAKLTNVFRAVVFVSSGGSELKSSKIDLNLTVNGARYGYNAAFSGDDVVAKLSTNNVGRPFIIYGVKNNKINVTGVDSIQSLIKSYAGYGCSDIDVNYEEVNGTSYPIGSALLSLVFQDEASPATHRNIKLHFNVKFPSGATGNTFSIDKQLTSGAADSTGRGHVIDGLEITGYMENSNSGAANITRLGAFAAPDVIKRLDVNNLTLVGNSAGFALDTLSGTALFTNVNAPSSGLYASGVVAPAKALFTGCSVANFTGATTESSSHHYIDCQILSGVIQNYTLNKIFENTSTPKGLLNLNSNTTETTTLAATASKLVLGSLAVATNIFNLPSFAKGLIRLHYTLVGDWTNTSQASSRETSGTKLFGFVVSSGGVITALRPVTDEVAPNSYGATPAVLTVSLVSGASAEEGAYIAVSATNQGATSVGIFKAEYIQYTPGGYNSIATIYPT